MLHGVFWPCTFTGFAPQHIRGDQPLIRVEDDEIRAEDQRFLNPVHGVNDSG